MGARAPFFLGIAGLHVLFELLDPRVCGVEEIFQLADLPFSAAVKLAVPLVVPIESLRGRLDMLLSVEVQLVVPTNSFVMPIDGLGNVLKLHPLVVSPERET